jgi:hypothetical protein
MDERREEGVAMSAKAKRILALMNDRKYRGILLDKLNKDNAPEGGPISGGPQEMKVLKEMNELDDAHDSFMDSLKGVTDG